MGGATDADDDLVAGRVNISESPTSILAADMDEGKWGGEFALQVGPADPPNAPSTSISQIINGTLSKGADGGSGTQSIGGVGGSGTESIGGIGGTGVLARGGGSTQNGSDLFPPPEAGVESHGGKFEVSSPTSGSSRRGHGPGVVGLAGNVPTPTHPTVDNVGVYGQGGDAESRLTPVSGTTVPLGPKIPGAGVLGRGGQSLSDKGIPLPSDAPLSPTGPGAAGVIGLASDSELPTTPEEDLGAGVFGFSTHSDGVRGHSHLGAGTTGHSTSNKGGIFSSDKKAQLQLTPRKFPDRASLDAFLQKEGDPGDLLASTHPNQDGNQTVALHFCLAARNLATGTPASWAQLA